MSVKVFGSDLIQAIPYIVILIAIAFLAKKCRDICTSFDDNEELFESDNPAIGIATAGYFLGIIVALVGVMSGGSRGLALDCLDLCVYGTLSIAFLNIARLSTDKFILNKFSIDIELVDDKNEGTSWVMFGAYIANGWVIYGAIAGEPSNLLAGVGNSICFFLLGQVAFILAAKIYQKFTPYDFHDLIEKDNVAAGLSFGGYLIALGTIIGHTGELQVTVSDITTFFLWSIGGAIILGILARLVIAEWILVPGHEINKEIEEDKNTNASWMELVAYQMVAWFFVITMM